MDLRQQEFTGDYAAVTEKVFRMLEPENGASFLFCWCHDRAKSRPKNAL